MLIKNLMEKILRIYFFADFSIFLSTNNKVILIESNAFLSE